MMKSVVRTILLGATVLLFASVVVAQPTAVTRMGDYIEIGDDVFMNLIFSSQWNYVTNTNNDFEGDVRDRTSSSNNMSTTVHTGDCDCLWEETRLGADLKYKKSLRVRILFEHQSTMDGNRIDNGYSDPGGEGGLQGRQRNTVNLERAWMRYTFPSGFGMEVGARLWGADMGRALADDDPRFLVFWKQGPLNLEASAVIQTESLRIGLENDNDDVYYTFGGKYNAKPWQIGFMAAYFRFRNDGADTRAGAGQEQNSLLLMPSIRGKFNKMSFFLQPMFVLGKNKRMDSAVASGSARDIDVAAWGALGQVEANMGKIRPFFAFVLGSGDDDPNDDELNGFSPHPDRSITLITMNKEFSVFGASPSWAMRDYSPPARSSAMKVSNEFLHTVANPWTDRIGNKLSGLSTTYSNPGTMTLSPGVKIYPMKGHNLNLFYTYRAVMTTEPIEALLGITDMGKVMNHEFTAAYTWKLNKHFSIRAVGNMAMLGDGGKDIAATVTTCGDGTQACEGEDIALRGHVRFRAAF